MNPKDRLASASFLLKTYLDLLKRLFIWLKNIPPKILKEIQKIRYTDLIIIIIGIFLALLLRYSLRSFVSDDFTCCVQMWYSKFQEQGKGALRYSFCDVHPLYLYCLYVVEKIFPRLLPLYAIKIPSVAADFVSAFFIFRIIRLKFNQGPLPLIAFFAVLFAPTVILNGSFWGQSDGLYTAALIACIYFVLTKRNGLACFAYGLAFAFKLQAIFLAPFILALFLKRSIFWKQLFLIPLAYLVTALPSWMLGRPILDILTVYLNQTSYFALLTMNAPTMYAWLPETLYTTFSTAGIIFAACIMFMYLFVIYKSRISMTGPLIVQLALISAILLPFVLPKMHERYFFAADIISIAFAFYFPKYFFAPIVINLVSFFSYEQFLFKVKPIPDSTLAIALFFIIIVLIRHLMLTLYQSKNSSLEKLQ